MSRASGQVLSRSNLNRTVFDYLSLFDLRQDQMLFVSKFFRTQPKQTAMVINSNGQVLIEKVVEFFFSEIARTAYGTIILNRGLFRNNQHTQTIRFKTFWKKKHSLDNLIYHLSIYLLYLFKFTQ